MLHLPHVRHLVIRPALQRFEKYERWKKLNSLAAEQLVFCTGLHESHYKYLDQLDRGSGIVLGPALGLFQMEKATFRDHWTYISGNDELLDVFTAALIEGELWEQLTHNLLFAAMMCRIHYWRVPEALPAADDLDGLAGYWKKYYNTRLGKGTIAQFKAACGPYWKEGL